MYHFQVSQSSSGFWNDLKLTWKRCADLPVKCHAISVAELDGKVYVAVTDSDYGDSVDSVPLMYDSYKDECLNCHNFLMHGIVW